MFLLRLFAGLSLEDREGPLSGRVVQRHPLALLAMLGAAGDRAGSRDKLAGFLWPKSDQPSARHRLADSVYVLRNALGEDAVLASGEFLRLNPEVIQCDVRSFEEALAREDLETAVELYSGPFLDGFYLGGEGEFEQWVETERQRQAELYASALESLAERAEATSDHPAAVMWWKRLVAFDPFNSRLALRLMQAMAEAGDRANALQYAQEHERLLRDELGLEPDADLVALVKRLRREPAPVSEEVYEPVRESERPETGIGTGPIQEPVRSDEGTGWLKRLNYFENRRRRSLIWLGAAAGLVVALTVWGLVAGSLFHWWRNRGLELQSDVVAVMPFHVVGDGVELWREGLVDLLAMALEQTGQYRSSDPRAVLNRWRKAVSDPEELPEPGRAARVASSLGAGQVVLGSVTHIGEGNVRVAADLYSVRWLRKKGSAEVEGSENRIDSLVDQLTVDLLKSVWQGENAPEVRVSAITTTSIPALRAYLEGEQALRRSRFHDAREAFTRAIEADSTFAIAHYSLGVAFSWIGDIPEDRMYLSAAARHSGGLLERDSLLILGWKLLLDGDLKALTLSQRLTRLYPDDRGAWRILGEVTFHLGAQAGLSRTAAIQPFERAVALDSSFAPALIHLVEIALRVGDTINGPRWADHYLSLDSTSDRGLSFRLLTALYFGPPEDSTVAVQALDTASANLLSSSWGRLRGYGGSSLPLYEKVMLAWADPRHPDAERDFAFSNLGLAYLRHGRVAEAEDMFHQSASIHLAWSWNLYVLSLACVAGLAVDSASKRLLGRLSRPYALTNNISSRGILAAHEGRMDEARAAAAQLDSIADSLLAAGDSMAAHSARGRAWTLRGRIAAAHDSADGAISHLRRGLAMMNAPNLGSFWHWYRDMDRYFLASLIQDRGGEEEALRIYGSLYWTPWLEALGYLRSARLHERRGERENALRDYARFVELWKDADPHLQPQVEAARRAIRALSHES